MKLTKTQLKQLIKEELKTSLNEDEDDVGDATEEDQDLVRTAYAALDAAYVAMADLAWEVEEEGFVFKRDSPVTLGDLESKMHNLNNNWKKIQGAV